MIKTFEKIKELRPEFKILFITALLNRMGTMALPFLSLYLIQNLRFSEYHAGLLLSLFGFGSLAADIISAWLCARFCAINIMFYSSLITSVILFSFPFFHNYQILIFVILLWSMTNEIYRPANLLVISELSTPEQRKLAFATNRLAINIGMSIGPAIGGFLLHFSFTALFIVNAITICATCIIRQLGLRNHAGEITPVATEKPPLRNLFMLDKRFFYFALPFLLATTIYLQHLSTLGIFLVKNLHFHAYVYGLFFALNTLMIVFFEIPLNIATAHWSHRKNLTLGSLFFAIGFGAFAFVHGIVGTAFAVILWSIGEMIFMPASSTYLSEIAPADNRGKYMAFYSAIYNASFILAPWMGMQIYSDFGADALWLMCLIVGLIAGLMFLYPYRKAQAAQSQSA